MIRSANVRQSFGYPARAPEAWLFLKGRTASKKALVLTAGHYTLRAQGPGQVLKNLKQERGLAINTLKFEARKACAATSVLLYATLTDIDIALYELTETIRICNGVLVPRHLSYPVNQLSRQIPNCGALPGTMRSNRHALSTPMYSR
jgi:hypothetical protein